MSSSLPESFTVTAATDDDAEEVAALSRAAEIAVRGESDFDPADVRDAWRVGVRERDTWVIRDRRAVVGAATLFPHGDAPTVWGDVHPDHVGRGLGSTLVDLSEARALERGAAALRNDVFAANTLACRLLERRGYREVRRHFQMRIDLGDASPPPPEWPEGLRVEPFRLEDARDFHAAQTEAFADEWGFVPMPFEEWRRLRLDADDFEPAVWSVVRDGEEIAAVARCDAHRYGGGWVGAIGVRKPWRRRGVGLALLRHTFRVFHERGQRRVGLGVDTRNHTGATRLYERAGMYVKLETVTYERALR